MDLSLFPDKRAGKTKRQPGRKGVPLCLAAVLLATVLYSCQKAGFTYDNIVDNQQTDYILTDTLSLTMKTVRYDSVPTSGAEILLTGIKADPLLGTSTISSFFRLIQPTGVNIPVNGSAYDSMRLIMRPTGYIAGDSTIPQSFQVFRLSQTIQTAKNYSNLFNNSNFKTELSPIGSYTGVIRPKTDQVIRVNMSDVLGRQLFTMLRDKSPDITATNTFQEFFKGLKITPGPGSAAVTAFRANDTSLVMRLYYHTNEIVTTVKYTDFKMNAPELQFNQVLTDRSGTPLAGLAPPVKELPSSATGGISYSQSITGVGTRIDIPYLKNMTQLGQFFKIMKVVLTVIPVKGTYNDNRLPVNLALCRVNKANEVTDTLSYGQLTEDDMYHERTAYTYDITTYCNTQLTADALASRGLLLTTPGGNGRHSLDRLAVYDQSNPKNKIKVQVYYLLYK